ncbi:MAG: hypothetical protein WCY01_05790 [Alkalispirochaeta sp.]
MTEAIVMIERVAAALGPLCQEVVFVGGAVVRLLVTDPGINEFRLTDDVDVIIDVASRRALADLDDTLREIGFRNAVYSGAPLCRWQVEDTIVDVMPTDPRYLGFSNRWYPEAIRTGNTVTLPSGTSIRVIDPVVFLATKLEAFTDRGYNDPIGSRDIEDVIAVVDGRQTIVAEITHANPDVTAFIRDSLQPLVPTIGFQNAVLGYLPHHPKGQRRFSTIMDRFRSITMINDD